MSQRAKLPALRTRGNVRDVEARLRRVEQIAVTGGAGGSSGGGGGSASWGGITGTLSSQTDLQTALNGKSSALSLAELDLGAVPVRSGRVTLTDAAIQATDKLSVSQAPGPYTGKGSRADEAELSGPITCTAVAGTGSATVYWSSPFVQRGNVKVHYTRG